LIPALRRIVAVGCNAQPGGDGIGGAEADAADVARQAVGVLRHHLHGVVAIGLEDPHRPGGANAMADAGTP
jgi:hypothetical protein